MYLKKYITPLSVFEVFKYISELTIDFKNDVRTFEFELCVIYLLNLLT